MSKKKTIPPPTELERKLRAKYNSFMTEHREEIHAYVVKRQKAIALHDEIGLIGVETHYEKLREKVGTALCWKEAADKMYHHRAKGHYIAPEHQWWAYLIDEELAEQKEREDQGKDAKPLFFAQSGG